MTTDALRRSPRPERSGAGGETLESAPLRAVYVWELPVRLTHWLIAGSIAVLAVTGVYIGNPFLLAPGAAGERFVMGSMKAVHSWAAIVFTLSVIARVGWMFAGNRWASWRELLPFARNRRRDIPGTLAFYTFLRSRPPETVGHNPVAGLTYALVFLLYFVEIATGLTLYSVSAHVESPLGSFAFLAPLFGGLQTARWIHHVVMWLLIGFVVHHVQSALLVSRAERNGILDSIFSGYKFLPWRREGER
jgi:Ni/Fe-hydrogenase 1 B-type cytochrome subunit